MKTKQELFYHLAVPNRTDRILLLTHTDLDGAGAAVLTKFLFPRATVKHCTNSVMSEAIRDACLAEPHAYDFIIACDISCTKADATELAASQWVKDHFVLIDHHPTAMHLNAYNWATIYSDMVSDSFRASMYEDPNIGHSSGTGLLYDYFEYNNLMPSSLKPLTLKLMHAFVSLVSMYDTWDWSAIFNQPVAKDLSALCFLYGIEYFEEEMLNRITRGDSNYLFNSVDNIMLRCENQKIVSHLERMRKSYRYGTITLADIVYNIVYCATSQYIPQTFEDMKYVYPDRDIYMINCGNTISMRACKANIDLSVIAKQLGGGGHTGAAGVPIPYEKQIAYFESAIGSKFNYQSQSDATNFFSS